MRITTPLVRRWTLLASCLLLSHCARLEYARQSSAVPTTSESIETSASASGPRADIPIASPEELLEHFNALMDRG
jgi:hypothetical protein